MYTQIKTFLGACKALKIKPTCNFSWAPKKDQPALIAHYQLTKIVEALNEGWKPDWNNSDQPKYWLWWDMEKSSSNKEGFSLRSVDNLCQYCYVGSRLCFRERAVAEYAAKQFKKLFKTYMIIS